MRISLVITALWALTAGPVTSQEIRFDVKDVGVLNHNIHGEGVVIVVQPDEMPVGGIRGPVITGAVGGLCNAFANQALTYVEEQVGLSDPDFVGVRIVSGGSFGRYHFQAYSIIDGGCGAPL